MANRYCSFVVPEGDLIVNFPEPLTMDSIDILDDCMRLVFRGMRRRASALQAVADGEAEYASWQHGSAGTSGVQPTEKGEQ